MNANILRGRVSTLFALVFFVLAMTLGDNIYTFGTILFTLLTGWFMAAGVSEMTTDKQITAEAAV
ncbi:MAG: hypothetical protein Q4G51_04995 [Dermatophilus congolensis]|nr:hypothetical protein [Dermatophilus congolensis]